MKVKNQKTYRSSSGKSDEFVVPKRQANKTGNTVAESAEGRDSIKGNSHTGNGDRTQSRNITTCNLMRVREVARRDKKVQFTSLLHHVDEDLLIRSYHNLERNSAAGADGVSWYDFGKDLEKNVFDLKREVTKGTYKPIPARRILIPKSDGSDRPISIQSVRDKILQQALVILLNNIYEEDFLGFSYGFRPNRSQHDALDALHVGLMKRKVNWVLDLDIRKFFDTVDHDWLLRFIEHRIKDKRIIRLIRKWLKIGYFDESGRRVKSYVGAPQGAVISPLLSNIYLHYVYDLWCKKWRGDHGRGDMIVVRYADDSVLGFQYKTDAMRFQKDLTTRMSNFGLELHEEKTKLIEFGRFAAIRRKEKGLGKPETFDFLGFTHYCGNKRKTGEFMVWRKTIRKRMVIRLRELRIELKRRMHRPIRETAKWLVSVIRGHMNYFSVPGNLDSVSLYIYELKKAWYKSLCRRSQRKRINWDKFRLYLAPLLPTPKVIHPYPDKRFYAKYPR